MSATVIRREYTNQFRPEKTSWLLGNSGDRITLELDVEVEISVDSSLGNPFESNGTDEIVQNVGDFGSSGFYVGTNVSWSGNQNGVPFSGTGVLTLVTPTILRVGSVVGTFPPAGFHPFNDGTTNNLSMNIQSTDNVQGVVFNYNFIANSDSTSGSLASLIDGTTPTFKADNIDPTDPTVIPMTTLGFTSGISVFDANIFGVSKVGPTQTFTITIEYQITPLFLGVNDFQNMIAPTPFFDIESITDVFQMTFLPQLNNPNVSIQTDSSSVAQDGNVGWFDENFDGNPANYTIIGTSYTDGNGLIKSSILKDAVTNFSIDIDQPGNTPTSTYKIGFAFVPSDQSLISSNNKFNYENLLFNGLGTTPLDQSTVQTVFTGAENDFGARMDVRFDSITNIGDTVTLSGQFQPNILFNDYFDSINSSDGNFIIWVSCADESLASNISDRVSILSDFGSFIDTAIPFTLGDVDISFLNHAQDESMSGSSTYSGSSEDEILTQSVMFLDTAKSESIDSISFITEGFNTISGQTFIAEQYDINTTSFAVDGSGVQQISVDDTRGFQMVVGLNKNLVQIERDPTQDTGTKVAYILRFAMRFRWEDWIQNNNVPNDLIDATKQFDGKNQEWSRLDTFATDWKLRFSIQTELNSDGDQLLTKNSSNVYVADYDESDVWDGAITHYDETKVTSLYTGLNADGIRTNAILDNDFTLVEADFDLEDLGGDVGSIGDYYGVIRIEVYQEGGQKGIEMISTILDNKNEILTPLSGETKCKITKISLTKIRLEALIDNNYLDLTKSDYKTSARIGYSNLASPGIYGTQYGTQYA